MSMGDRYGTLFARDMGTAPIAGLVYIVEKGRQAQWQQPSENHWSY